jgi:uncharacterized membrane protein (UPF0127 family)
MRALLAAVIGLSLTASACSYGNDSGNGAQSARSSAKLPVSTALIDTGDDSVLLKVEVADDEKERERGLMFRDSLAERSGMVFIFFEQTAGGFWMKNTRIPLSIAFFDRDGKILRILDMDPCRRDPCKVYDPGVAYWGALEVNQGAFDRWGVEPGDAVEVT